MRKVTRIVPLAVPRLFIAAEMDRIYGTNRLADGVGALLSVPKNQAQQV